MHNEQRNPSTVIGQRQVKRAARDTADNPKKRVKFSLRDDACQIGGHIEGNRDEVLSGGRRLEETSTENTCTPSRALLPQGKSSTSENGHRQEIIQRRNVKDIRPNSEREKHIYECTNYTENHYQPQSPTTPYGICNKVQEKKASSDQQGCKKLAVESIKDKRSNDLATIDSHNFRTSSTNEVNRLRYLIEEQENEILSLQEKLDSKLETNAVKGFSEQALLAKCCANVDTFPAMYNQAEFPYDQDSSRAFSSLVTINHQKNTEEMALRKENMLLKNELQEAKDHMELLEFRILEFTEDQKTPQITRCDQGTSTDGWIDNQQSTKHNTSSQSSRVSKEYLKECHQRLQDICDSSDNKSSSLHLKRFMELKDQFKKFSELNESVSMDFIPVMDKINEISEFLPPTILPPEVESSQQITFLDTDKKLPEDQWKIDLLSKLEVLTKENKELHELIATLSESHETQTEASGTESELVHGKTPSISSDLSDTECDAVPNLRDTKSALHNLASLQESGIFESQCDTADVGTQTIEGTGSENILLSYSNQYISMSLASSIDNDHVDGATDSELSKDKQFNKIQDLNAALDTEEASAVRVQDLQESDEYLLSEADDRVILNKGEYDAIVAEERHLRAKIEELNAENEELTLKCDATEAQLALANSKTSSNEDKESMRGAVRVLEEKLHSAEKHSKQFFEEKCEYEEAENDARLMVQRMQSQLEAAKEMEALLSASLSQEQEFSRELHKCLSDLQAGGREDKMKEEKYLREIKALLEREKCLMSETQLLKVHYFTIIFKLLVREYFKKTFNQWKLEIKYDVKSSNEESDIENNKNRLRSSFLTCMKLVSESPLLVGYVSPKLRLSIYPHIQSDTTLMDYEGIDAQVLNPIFNKEPMDCIDPYSEMHQESNLTDRESYYLQQIEILQHEKKNLRNDFENNDGERYQEYVSCRNELDRISIALEKSESENCKLIFRIEELQYELQSAKDANEESTQNLRFEYSSMCENLQREKQDMSNHYEGRVAHLNNVRRSEEVKAEELKRKLTFIHLELAPYIDETMRNGSLENVNDDLVYVSNLVKSEASLRDKIFELQEKERAYMETIAEADKIMSAHVTSYNKRIKEMESKLKDKNPILSNLEERLQSMKEKISFNSSCLESNELEDFFSKVQLELHKLNFAPNRANSEANFLDAPDTQVNEDDKSLDAEFYEKEELLQKLLKLTTEKSSLSSQLQEAHEASRKMSEMLQNEHYFKSRVEELESSETCLREDLKKYENCIVQKERKYEDKMNIIKEEISSLKCELEQAERETQQAKNSESLMKNEVTELKGQIETMKSELQETSDENANTTTQHRLEVARLRSQLNITNSQLIEIGGVSGDLTEKLSTSEQLLKEVSKQLEEKAKRHEADILSFNLKITQKESCIEDMEAHMQQLKHNEAASELDGLASLPFSELHNTLQEIFKGLKECSRCDKYSTSIAALMEHSEIFRRLINGRTIHSDSESEGEKSKAWETEKVSSVSDIHQEANPHKSCQVIDINPCVPPRPRRDAKLKRKWKRSSTSEESIMDELHATMKSVKKPHHGKIKAKEKRQNIKLLENKVKSREEELELADMEVTELYGKLALNNEAIEMKQVEISSLQNSMVTFRKEFLATVEKNEKARQDTDEKHKEEMEAMRNVSNQMKNQLSNSKQNTTERNHLIKFLIEVIRAEVCSKNFHAILTNVLKCAATPEINDVDYSNEKLLEDLKNMIKQTSIIQEEMDNSSPSRISKPELLCTNNIPDVIQCQETSFNRTSLKTPKKSKIPKLKLQYISGLKESIIAREAAKQNINKANLRIKRIDPSSKRLPSANLMNKQNNTRCAIRKTNIVHRDSQKLRPIEGNRLTSKKEKTLSNQKGDSNHIEKPANVGTSTEGQIQQDDRLDKIIPSLSVPNRCYMRSLKRALPTVAMKHEARKPYQPTLCQRKSSHKQESPIDVPRPQSLKITRRVGIDGAVIAWDPMENDCIAGFQVILDGRVIQQVRSPKRTKALVNGLPFKDGFTISLSTISTEGRCSIPVTVTHQRLSVDGRKAQGVKSKRLKTTFACFSP